MADDKLIENNTILLCEETETYPLVESIYEVALKVASTNIGQFLIRKTDRLLWTIENTAKWSLPQVQPETEREKSLPPPSLIRPLPWIFFIPALIALRLNRVALSFIALMIGLEPITPTDVVRFTQIRRKKLRAIKYQGLKQIRYYNMKKSQNNQKNGVFNKFLDLINKLICSNTEIEESVEIIVTKTYKSTTKDSNNVSKKRHLNEVDANSSYEEQEQDDKTLLYELLNKSMASDTSDDDPDFEINEDDESEESEDSDDSVVNEEISDTEDIIAIKYSEQNNKIELTYNSNYKESEEKKEEETNVPQPHQNNIIENNNHNSVEPELNHVNSSQPIKINSVPVTNQKKSPKIGQNGGFDEVNGGNQYANNNNNNKAFYCEDNLTIPPTIYGYYSEEKYYSPIGSPVPSDENHVQLSQFDENSQSKLSVDTNENENKMLKLGQRPSTIPTTTATTTTTTTTNHNNINNNNINNKAPTSLNDVKNNIQSQIKQNNNHRRASHYGNKKSNKK